MTNAASFALDCFAFGCATAFPAAGQQIHGSGSTFVYPVLAKWSEAYQKVSGVHVEYQPLGSSGGLTEIRAESSISGFPTHLCSVNNCCAMGSHSFPW